MVSSFLLASGVHISQNNNLICCSIELPSSENENVRSYRGGSVTVSAQRWLSLEFSFLPDELIVGVEHYEVVDVCWRDEILFASCTGVDAPPSEKNDIRATDICAVTVTGKRRRS